MSLVYDINHIVVRPLEGHVEVLAYPALSVARQSAGECRESAGLAGAAAAQVESGLTLVRSLSGDAEAAAGAAESRAAQALVSAQAASQSAGAAQTAQAAAEQAGSAALAASGTAAVKASEAASSAALAGDWAVKTSAAVSGGEYSAKHHAQAAAASADGASSSQSLASGYASASSLSATTASGAASLAGEYANYPEDQQIPGHPGEYSAYHFSRKAQASAGGGAVKITTSDTTAATLNSKVGVSGDLVSKAVTNPGGNEVLTITVATPTKTQVGLGNVSNDAQLKASDLDTDGTLAADSDAKLASQKAVKTYADTKIAASAKGAASGVCGLDTNSKVAAANLPALVGDSGSGGTLGAAPAPASGDAAKGKWLGAGGSWTQTLVQYGETRIAKGNCSGATTLDLATGSLFTATATGNVTWTFSNPLASGTLSSFVLALSAGGSYTQTWPGGVKWPGGSAPSLSTSGVDCISFFTHDGGTTWYGCLSMKGCA